MTSKPDIEKRINDLIADIDRLATTTLWLQIKSNAMQDGLTQEQIRNDVLRTENVRLRAENEAYKNTQKMPFTHWARHRIGELRATRKR
jgi:hypothetical protein